MSTPPTPPPARAPSSAAADAASLRQIRALFQRRMLDRAIALANARWPGAGEMVQLAAEWAALSPADRRARLSRIGPEDLARLRALADLNPDLARVLDDLEARGVLPRSIETAEPGAATYEALVDTALNLAEEAARQVGEHAADPENLASVAAADVELGRFLPPLETLPTVEMPELDLGLPSTDAFLAEEAERRLAAATAAEALLERVRRQVERSAARLTRATDEAEAVTTPQPQPEPPPTTPDIGGASDESPATAAQPPASAPHPLVAAIRERRLIVVAGDEPVPSEADITSIATTIGLPLHSFNLEPGSWREVFGGIRRRGPEMRVEPGPLPRALAGPNLVVVRGAIYPTMVARWREGYCDIPGTKASTRIAPECRILVLPPGS